MLNEPSPITIAIFVIVGIGVLVTAFITLFPVTVTRLALEAERRRAHLTKRECKLADGTRFVYLEGGYGEPLVLLHGFGGNKDNFARVARWLVPHYRVIIPDAVGFGESSHPESADYSPSAQAQRLRELMQRLNIETLHLGGNSMGGQIALMYAHLFPSMVKSLWLISPAGIWSAPKSDAMKAFIERGENLLSARNVLQFRQILALGMYKAPWIPTPILNVLAQERIHNADLEHRILRHILDCSLESTIRGMTTPTLLVFGEQDRLIPSITAQILRDLIPCAQVKIMANVGHVAMFENPRQCGLDYLSFRETGGH